MALRSSTGVQGGGLTKNIRALFYDKQTQKTAAAASIHWPTARKDGLQCADENVRETNAELRQYTADLYIFGGDTNVTDLNGEGWRSWYKIANGDLAKSELGYRDVIYDLCKNTTNAAQSQIKSCIRKDNWTFEKNNESDEVGTRRIDFLFVKRSNSTMPTFNTNTAHTVTFAEANNGSPNPTVDYSDHRAVHARINYMIYYYV